MSEIPLFEIPWTEDDIDKIVKSVKRGSYWAEGPFIDDFQDGLRDYFNVQHALVLNSGTTALECSLRSVGVGPGDEVLVPSFTFIATVNVVELVGATPVFVDVDRETIGMDPDDAREKVTADTVAMIPIHCYGSACQIEELADIAENNDLALIEDAAEAFGAKADDQLVGTFGEIAALSFCQNKILPTGEGGAVLTDDDELAAFISRFRSHGRAKGNYFDTIGSGEYLEPGSNYRMPDIVAALGLSQLSKVEDLIDGRRSVARIYGELLSEIEGVRPVSGRDTGGDRNVYQLYTVMFGEPADRTLAMNELSARDIACKVYWDPPVHRMDYYRGREADGLSVTDDISGRVLSLPMHPNLTTSELEQVAKGVSDAIH